MEKMQWGKGPATMPAVVPLVMHHGLFGFGEIHVGPLTLCYFHGLGKSLANCGCEVIVTRVHPTGGIARRAAELKQRILSRLAELGCPGAQVVIIAHSMGGLDARYMISRLGMATRVRALVTITTPHRGSPYADWCVRHLGKRLGGFKLMNDLGLDVDALRDLTTANCERFNHETQNVDGVRYFSVTAARPWRLVTPVLYLSHRIVSAAEGNNDGLVSVKSGSWGEHLGTWPADHLHTINRRMVVELRNKTGDITPYYLEVLERLRADGLMER